jgi:predicted nucleic acid-binding protein
MGDAIELGRRIRGVDPYPTSIDVLHPSRVHFDDATDRFEAYADQGLSFTDVLTTVLVEHHSIDSVVSFDDDFDGIVDRLDPATIPPTN